MIASLNNNNSHQFTAEQQTLLQMLDNLIKNIDIIQIQSRIQNIYQANPQLLIATMFSIVIKCARNVNKNNQYFIQIVLLYFKAFVNKQNNRMPEIGNYFIRVYQAVAYSKHNKQLVILALCAYYTNKCHTIYLKEFLSQQSRTIMTSYQSQNLSSIQYQFYIQSLYILTLSKQYRPGLSMQANRIACTFMNQYSMKRSMNINQNLWVWGILVICQFCGKQANSDFVRHWIINNHIQIRSIIKLTQVYNKIHHRYGTLQASYHLLQTQLKRISDHQFIAQIQQQCQSPVQSIQEIVKSILFVLSTCFMYNNNSNNNSNGIVSQIIDLNQLILFQYFKQYAAFSQTIISIVSLSLKYRKQSTQLTYLLARIIQQFHQFLQQDKFKQYCTTLMTQIKDIDDCYMYVLLAAVNRTMMEIFGGQQRLQSGINKLLQYNVDARLQDDTVQYIQILITFGINYLSTHQYIPQHILQYTNSLIIFLSSSKTRSYYSLLLLQSYSLSLACRIQKFNTNTNVEIINNIYMKAYQILMKVYIMDQSNSNSNTNSSRGNKEDIVEIVADGIQEFVYMLGNVFIYAYQGLITYFQNINHNISHNKQQIECNILINSLFLKNLQSFYTFTHKPSIISRNNPLNTNKKYGRSYSQKLSLSSNTHNSSNNSSNNSNSNSNKNTPVTPQAQQLLPILSQLVSQSNNNKAILDQTCQFCMKILYITNIQYGYQGMTHQKYNNIVKLIYNTSIYQYVKQCVIKGQEDVLYMKLLFQSILHKQMYHVVIQILMKLELQQHKYMAKQCHNGYDVIWESLVILYQLRNQYTQYKGINKKIDQIMGGSLQALMDGLTVDQKKQWGTQNDGNKRVNWKWLPQVRKVVQAGSYVASVVQDKLNSYSKCY